MPKSTPESGSSGGSPPRGWNLRPFFLPRDLDEGFRVEIGRTALLALRVIGMLELVVPMVMLAAGVGVVPVPNLGPNVVVAVVGAGSLLVSWLLPGRARFFAGISMWLASAVIAFTTAREAPSVDAVGHFLLGYFAMVMLGAASGVPFQRSIRWHSVSASI